MKIRKLITLMLILIAIIHISKRLYIYYSPAKEREIYKTTKHDDDTLRIAYIGDSWAFGHSDSWTFGPKPHTCRIASLIKEDLHIPVIVESFGIGGLTSKEVYYSLFDIDSLKFIMKKGCDYCYISAGINDTHKKMSTSYYKNSMDCIIRFMLQNNIHPIIQEVPDYNIIKFFNGQETSKKIKRRLSMFINNIPLDCKQQFRDALDELIAEKGYQNKVSIVRYKLWNNDYANDLQDLYIGDQLHLNYKGYERLDSVIAKTIIEDVLHNK